LGETPTPSFAFYFKKNGMVPATTPEELDRILAQHPEVKDCFIDGVERSVTRSTKGKYQKQDYSGKKKRHMKKNIAITSEKHILAIGPTSS
jgi:hypothetical protein